MPDERDAGFRHADISTDLLADPKLMRLAKRIPDEAEYAATVLVYLAVVLASWKHARRVDAEEAEAIVTPNTERVAHLQAVSLLDDMGMVPERAWDRWMGPAMQRVEAKSAAGKAGAAARWADKGVRPDAAAMRPHSTRMRTDAVESGSMRTDAQHSAEQNSAVQVAAARDLDDDSHLQAWYQATASAPSAKVLPWLDRLAGEYGPVVVGRAIGEEALADMTRTTLLSRVELRLTTAGRALDRQRTSAQRKAQQVAADEERARIEAMPPEQRAANMKRLRDAMADAGLAPAKKRNGGE
jgi:hypothetical protein